MIDVTCIRSIRSAGVGARTIEPGEARVVTVSQCLRHRSPICGMPCTNIERIPRWFLPISGDLRVGGRYQLEGNGKARPDLRPAATFTATWEYGGNISWIEVRVSGEGPDRSRLELDHIIDVDDQLGSIRPRRRRDGLGRRDARFGLHLSTGEAIDPSFGQRWTGTEDGRPFMTLAGDAWYQAEVAGGADPACGSSAADRCLEAYLGEE